MDISERQRAALLSQIMEDITEMIIGRGRHFVYFLGAVTENFTSLPDALSMP